MSEPAKSPPAATPVLSRTRRGLVLAATVLGSSLAFIDSTAVNVALPAIQRDLLASVADLQWIANGYLLMLAAVLLVGGAAGDRYGRKLVFMLGVAAFAVASVGCALSTDADTLIIARAAQGLASAFLVPNSLALLSATYPREARGRAIGAWSAFAAMTTAFGPVLGGWLVDTTSWPAAFWINLPIAAICLVLAAFAIPESRDANARGNPDILGAVLVILGLGALTWALIALGESQADNRMIIGLAVSGVTLMGVFFWVEGRVQDPMLPPYLMKIRTFASANLLTLLLYGALGGVLFIMPLGLIRVHGYTASEAGASFLPFPAVMFLLSRYSGTLVDKFGPRLPLVLGPFVTGIGLMLLAWPETGTPYWSTYMPGIIVLGLGMSICIAPLTTTVMNSVDDDHAGIASAVNNAASRVAGLLSVAAVGPILVPVFMGTLEPRLVGLPEAAIAAAHAVGPEELMDLIAPKGLAPEAATALMGAAREAFVQAFRAVLLALSGFAYLSAIVAWFTLGPERKNG
jgi:EmrB/QacA subfamily drug resistance transporter